MAWQFDSWFLSNREDNFRYVEVDRKTMRDIADIDEAEETGGTIDFQDLTSLKVKASLPFVGNFDIGNNYLRIYSQSYSGDESIEILHGTFIVSRPKSDYSGAVVRGTLDCYSLLQLAEEQKLVAPVTYAAGINPVAQAKSLLTAAGLVVISDASTMTLTTPRNYDTGESYLKVANDLLSVAGFSSAGIDAAGNAILSLYRDPSLRAASLVLSDAHPNVIFSPVVSHDFDVFDVPNKVTAVYSNPDDLTGMTATATNIDPQSIYSYVNRGRWIPHVEEVDEVASQTALQAVADRTLVTKSSAVESVEFEHSYVPYAMGDNIQLEYTKHGLDFLGTAVNKTVSLKRGMPCKARLRRFVRM